MKYHVFKGRSDKFSIVAPVNGDLKNGAWSCGDRLSDKNSIEELREELEAMLQALDEPLITRESLLSSK